MPHKKGGEIMGVHKDDRNESGFETMEHAQNLVKLIRELSIIRNFGLKIRESRIPGNFSQWSEKSQNTWKTREAERMEKLKLLDSQFLMAKRRDIHEDLMAMLHGISSANSIKYPSSMVEADERRIHMDRAIAACENLRIDLQDIMSTLPIDKNWMTHVDPEIDAQIRLLRAWRKSDNEKRRALRLQDMNRWIKFLASTIKKRTENPDDADAAIELDILKGVYQAFLNDAERISNPNGKDYPKA